MNRSIGSKWACYVFSFPRAQRLLGLKDGVVKVGNSLNLVSCEEWSLAGKGKNIYSLTVEFMIFDPLLWWYRRHLKRTHAFLLFQRNEQSNQMLIHFVWRNRQFAEGERMQDVKDVHLILVAVTVTFASPWTLTCEFTILSFVRHW